MQVKTVYNDAFKLAFINEKQYAASTRRTLWHLFEHSFELERKYMKDLHDFDENQIGELLKSLNSTTIRGIQNYTSSIRQYIQYAMIEKCSIHRENPMDFFHLKDEVVAFLSKEKKFFSQLEIKKMAERCTNAQDGVILSLIFDGISHKNRFKELSDLTIDQLDEESREICVGNRNISISEHTLSMIQKAHKEEYYHSLNAESARKYKLTPSEYMLKGVRNKKQVGFDLIHQRIIRVSKFFGYEHLNATNISYSGQIHYGNVLLNEGKEMEEVLEIMTNRFDLEKNSSAKYSLRRRILESLQ